MKRRSPENSAGQFLTGGRPALTLTFLQEAVESFYVPLFKFAHRLCGNPIDAADFTQETFYLAQTRGHQLHTPGKVKSWLFTTLYREFLKRRLRHNRFPEVTLEEVPEELMETGLTSVARADIRLVLQTLAGMEERYRLPLQLFYLEDKTYREISEMVPLPIGTVMSRISRGRRILTAALNG